MNERKKKRWDPHSGRSNVDTTPRESAVAPAHEDMSAQRPRSMRSKSREKMSFIVSGVLFMFLVVILFFSVFDTKCRDETLQNVQTTSGSRSPLILNSKPPICNNSGGLQPLRYHQNQKFELKGSGHYW